MWAKAKHGKWEFQVSESSGERVFQARYWWWWGVQFHRAYRLERLWIYMVHSYTHKWEHNGSTIPVHWFQTDGLFHCGSYNMAFVAYNCCHTAKSKCFLFFDNTFVTLIVTVEDMVPWSDTSYTRCVPCDCQLWENTCKAHGVWQKLTTTKILVMDSNTLKLSTIVTLRHVSAAYGLRE